MKIQNFWYFFCLVFAFLSLNTLVEESYEVTYMKNNETEHIQFLICVELNDLQLNKTEIDLRKLREYLYDHFESSVKNEKRKEDSSGFERFKRELLNRTRLGKYLVFNGRACLITKFKKNLPRLRPFLPSKTVFYAIKRDTFDLVKMSGIRDKINTLTVLKTGHPYFNCSQNNARFRCLHKCFKRSFRLARYFYESNETGLIYLNYSNRNRSLEENEKNCFRECKRENCKMVQQTLGNHDTKLKSEIFEAQPKLSTFDYWLQLIGLVTSFAGICLNEFAFVVIEFIQSKVRRRKIRIALSYLKLVILFLGLASFGYLCAQIILDHKAKENNPLEETRHLIQPEIVRLIFCATTRRGEKYFRNSYKDKTMWEIEKATDLALNDMLGVYLDYQGRSFRTDYQVQPKKLFKNYHRCFELSIRPNYQMIPSHPKLKIKKTFNKRIYYDLYLLSDNENLNEKSFKYTGDYAFQKRMVTRLRSSGKCLDYELKYVNCTGRQNCLERCINKKLVEKHNRTTLSLDLVIDRDWISSVEWNTSYPIETTPASLKIYEDIEKICLQEIPDVEPCLEAKFETKVEIKGQDYQTDEIDLPLNVVRLIEGEPSLYKLALNIASIPSILFGLTVLSILQMICSLIQTAFRLKENKFVLFLLYLLCSLGASWHTYHILQLVIRGELVATQHYELTKRVQMPVMVFCLQIDQKLVDRNHQLSGSYLEELTGDITTESTFKSIIYLNESNEWVSFDLNLVKRFFLRNMKCFKMKIDQEYDRDQFHFSTGSQVLNVNLIHKIHVKKKLIHFMTESKGTAEFSKIFKLNKKFILTQETSLYKYEDRFSFIRKHFSSFQEDEASDLPEQLLELQRNEHNLRTLNLPLEDERSGMEVEEGLFEQLYSVWNRNIRNKMTDFNYQQLFVDNHFRQDDHLGPNLAFNLVFLQKVVSSTNEENFGQIILNLLNVLSIWLDLGVLDLHPVLPLCHDYLLVYLYLHLPHFLLNKITQFLLFSCKWLKKFEPSLYKRLDARKQNQRKTRRFARLKTTVSIS